MNKIDTILFDKVSIFLLPAYGRQYSSAEEALNDWKSGKDFQDVQTGQYASIRDIDLIKDMCNEAFLVWNKWMKPIKIVQIL